MLSKEQKIRLITDIKQDRITKKIINILKKDVVVLFDKSKFKKEYNLSDSEFDEVYNYIEDLCSWHVVKPACNVN